VIVVALWFGRIAVLAGAAVAALLWAGLYFSYSQSSMVALCAGLLTATLVAATPRVRWIVLAVGAASVLLAGSIAIASGHRDSLTRFTSGRSDLVRDTLHEIRDHPVLGVGIGNEARVGAPARRQGDFVRTPSHTTPLTVTAELGIAGALAYLAFLACSALLVVRVYRRDPVVGLTLGTLLVALVVHSLFYSGFFEDPLTWGILALGAATLTAPAFARGTAPAAAPTAEARTT
jgi:O-antigen ligase